MLSRAAIQFAGTAVWAQPPGDRDLCLIPVGARHQKKLWPAWAVV